MAAWSTGTHNELLNAVGRYAELFTMQARGHHEQRK